jgi:hypothetical protein
MSATTTPIVLTGGVTMLSDYMNGRGVEFRVALATGIAAGIFGLFEKADPQLAVGLAWVVFVTSLIVPHANGTPSPVETFLKEWSK